MVRIANVFNELSEHVSFRIHSVSQAVHAPGWEEQKRHKDFDLWLIRSGSVTVRTGGELFRAGPGDAVLFYPQLPYTAYTDDLGCTFLYIHFDFGIGEHMKVLQDYVLAGVVPGLLIQHEFALAVGAFDNRAWSSTSALQLKGYLLVLLSSIIAKYESGEYRGGFDTGRYQQGPARSLEGLRPVFQHIEENLEDGLPISQLASLAGMSEKYFITYFKQTVGITPGKYMYQVRMNRARDLLHQRQYSVKQIAALTGYPDAFSFSKAFKRYFKVSPSQFV